MVILFKEFIKNLVVESLHPELQDIVKNKSSNTSKQTQLAKKIKELSSKGESTGIEGNMPKGSSRAYMKHSDLHETTIDGKPAKMHIGTKVAIKAKLDKYHNKKDFDDKSLGSLQNKAETGDHWVNNSYRTLTKHDNDKSFTSNERGIFPPLVHDDEEHHEWNTVGHARDIKAGEFRALTKTESHPKGISHEDFSHALERHHNRNVGRHWGSDSTKEKHLDSIDEHPLVQKFNDYHGNTGNPPHDYRQKKNMGIWEHPLTGEKHIVARDHGYDSDVESAYQKARSKQFGRG